MKAFIGITVALAVILVVIGIWYVGTYNGIINADEEVTEAGGNIDTVLQRRFDLIPNLVGSVKGIMKHEKGVLEEVTRLRASVGQMNVKLGQGGQNPDDVKKFMVAQNQLGSALSRLLVVVEKYPDIKAGQNVTQLMDELAGTENRIAVQRIRYNKAVKTYNTRIRGFFGRIVAGNMGMEPKEPFKAPEATKEAPKVEL